MPPWRFSLFIPSPLNTRPSTNKLTTTKVKLTLFAHTVHASNSILWHGLFHIGLNVVLACVPILINSEEILLKQYTNSPIFRYFNNRLQSYILKLNSIFLDSFFLKVQGPPIFGWTIADPRHSVRGPPPGGHFGNNWCKA